MDRHGMIIICAAAKKSSVKFQTSCKIWQRMHVQDAELLKRVTQAEIMTKRQRPSEEQRPSP